MLGLTEIEAVGAGGGGGGGGGGGTTFFLHAPSRRRALRLSIRTNHVLLYCFTWFLLGPQRSPPRGPDEVMWLFPTPIGLRIMPSERQLLNLGSSPQHAPDLEGTRPVGLKHYMPSVGRPRRKIVAPAIVRELHPLLAGNIHQVDIQRSGIARSVLAHPGKGQELSVRRPVRRHRVSLIRHARLIGAVGFHGVNLR